MHGVSLYDNWLYVSRRNQEVIRQAVAKDNTLNRFVVQVDHSCDDAALETREGRSWLVAQHVTHGGVGPFTRGAIEFLKGIGAEIDPHMIPAA